MTGTSKSPHLPLLLALIATAVLVIFPMGNYDIFWHLANGRAMLEEGRIIQEDIFSYTAHGAPFHNHEWLSQIFFYLVYSSGGANLLIALKCLLAAATSALLYHTLRRNHADPYTAALLAAAAILIGVSRYTVRPQMFSHLFLATLGLILYRYREGDSGWKGLLFIPAIMLLWDTLHGAIYGLVFLSAFIAGETAKNLSAGLSSIRPSVGPLGRKPLLRLWGVFGLSLLLMLISPFGPRSYSIFLDVAGSSNIMAISTFEFMPATLSTSMPFWILLAAVVVLMAANIRRLDLTHLFVLLPFAVMTIRYRRAVAAFAIVAMPLLAHSISLIMKDERTRSALRRALVVVAALLALYAVSVKYPSPGNKYALGAGLSAVEYPAEAVGFVKETGLDGNMYNPDIFGGYLAYQLYPQRRIFLYNLPTAFGGLLPQLSEPGFIDRYKINYAFITYDVQSSLIFRPEQWAYVYWDGHSAVVVRRAEENRAFLDRYALNYLVPGITAELLSGLESNPDTLATITREAAHLAHFGGPRWMRPYLDELLARPDNQLDEAEKNALRERAKGF